MENIGFHAHGFVIIDVIPSDELQTAKRFEENITDFIDQENSELFCERYRCNDEPDLINVFEKIKNRLKEKGKISYIHIEGHASKDSLQLLDGSTVSWIIIFNHFREINILCENNLFFSSGSCESAYAFKSATIRRPSPVFGLLAPEKIVTAGGVQDGFIAFYKSLISKGSLNDAFHAFACATDAKQYSLLFSQLLFQKAAYSYIKEHCTGKGRQKRLESVVTKAVQTIDIPVNKTRKFLKKELNRPQALNLRKFYRVFMMIDIFPDNEKRFEFNAVKFEQEVKSGKIKIV